MAGIASAFAAVLAVVFAWAGVAKLARHADTALAFASLGLPAPLAWAVPAAELAVAGVLLVRPPVGAAAALALLALFSLVLVRALARGEPVRCACFGARRAEVVSPGDVVRNGVLAAFAAVATGTRRLVAPGFGAAALAAALVVAGAALIAVARRRLA